MNCEFFILGPPVQVQIEMKVISFGPVDEEKQVGYEQILSRIRPLLFTAATQPDYVNTKKSRISVFLFSLVHVPSDLIYSHCCDLQ